MTSTCVHVFRNRILQRAPRSHSATDSGTRACSGAFRQNCSHIRVSIVTQYNAHSERRGFLGTSLGLLLLCRLPGLFRAGRSPRAASILLTAAYALTLSHDSFFRR